MKSFLFILSFINFYNYTYSQEHSQYFPDPDPVIQAKLESWRDLKFGLLMHWGPYSQWSVVESWSICPEDVGWATGARKKGMNDQDYFEYKKTYENLKNSFNPVNFNPERWAAAAKDAGMKYMVFTTKHHDGFCMFDTKYTDYKITDPSCPFHTNVKSNIAKEVFDAFRKQGMWTGAYFSKPDWHSDFYWWSKFPPADRNCNYQISKYPGQWNKFIEYTHNQLLELVGGEYGKLDILWLDGGWVRKKTNDEVVRELKDVYDGVRWARNPQSQDIDMPTLVKKVRAKQPDVLVVDRAVPGPYQNYLTPEQQIPESGLPYPWETCMTMANSWSYVSDDVYKPTSELIKKLVDIVSKGGNYLLNIGPSPQGEYSDTAYARLKEIGSWMKINGEAIYSTRMYKSYNEGEKIRYTQSKDGKAKYVFLLEFPSADLILNKISITKDQKLSLLGSDKPIRFSQSNKGLKIALTPDMKETNKYIWVLKIS